MSIRNIGGFAAGLVRGNQMANEDKFLEEQRARQRKEWAEKDELDAALKEVRPAGEFDVDVPTFKGMTGGYDQQDAPLKRTKMTRTDADVLADQARVYQSKGKVKEGAELVGLARSERKGARDDKLTRSRDELFANYGKMMALLNKPGGHIEFARTYGPQFNADQIGGPDQAGARVAFDPDYKRVIYLNKDGQIAGESEWNPQSASQAARQLFEAQLAALSAEDYATAEDRAIKRGQLANQKTTADAAMRTATATENYRRDQAARPQFMQDGSGRVLAIAPDGKTVLGTYGSPRPQTGSGANPNAGVKMASITMTDPTTNKPVKVPVLTRFATGKDGAPQVQAFTLDGKPVTDSKLLAQLAGGDLTPADPQMAGIDAQIARLQGSMTPDNFEAAQAAIAKLNSQKQLIGIQRQLKDASPDERVEAARGLIAQGATPEALAGLGLSQEEIKAARKPAANPSAPAAPGVSRAAPTPALPAAVEAAGQQLDAAREQLRTLTSNAPGLARGRAAMDAHAAQVAQAREMVRRAEAAYQQSLQTNNVKIGPATSR